jgi:cyanophycinase
MAPHLSNGQPQRGWIVPIGGRIESRELLDRFVDLCGGPKAAIAIIPTASSESDTGPWYQDKFRALGCTRSKLLPLDRRSDCDDEDWLSLVGEADGVFFTGGNQGRLGTVLGGTPIAELIQRRNREDGLHVAGTSAGAAFLCEHMIAGGAEGPTPHSKMVTLCAGLGLTNRAIIDQHFTQRNRLGRLLSAISYNPFCVGLGIDEDTGAFIAPDDTIEIEGSGAVTVIDPSGVEFTSIDSARAHEPVAILGLGMHILTKGTAYHLGTREAHVTESLAVRR